jgi:hypothetical protein
MIAGLYRGILNPTREGIEDGQSVILPLRVSMEKGNIVPKAKPGHVLEIRVFECRQ